MRGSKFGKEDDVMLDREIKKLQRKIDKLVDNHANLYDDFSKLQNRFHDNVETVDDRLRILENMRF